MNKLWKVREAKFRMGSAVRWGLIVAVGLFGVAAGVVEAVETEETPVPKSPTADAKVSIPVAEGQDVIGLRIPHFNEHGELILQISAEVARRLDEEHVEMENMRIEFFNEDRERMEIVLATSTFNLESRVLKSDRPSTISREDFTIEGETLEFDLADQVGRMHGSVTMTIHSTETDSE